MKTWEVEVEIKLYAFLILELMRLQWSPSGSGLFIPGESFPDAHQKGKGLDEED
jgi:hypothetical protein